MNPKAAAVIEKACEDRQHSNFKKALSRLEEGIEKFPREFSLHTEAIDVSMESGESLKAIQFFKRAQQTFSSDVFELWTFTAEKAKTYNDSIVGRFLLEQAIRGGDLAAAGSVLEGFTDHAANELLERIRTKKQTVSGSVGAGFSAREDIVSYTLTEALLCLRLLRFSEAMDGFIRALDESPNSSKALAPYLADAEQRHGQSGEMSYALACCYIARTEYAKGFDKLGHAVRMSPALVSKAIDRIESVGDQPEVPVGARNMNLAQLYLGVGGMRQATDLLSTVLDRDPLRAPDIIDMLKPAVETAGNELEPQFLFVEAAFAAGRRETALSQLRKIYEKRAHRGRLVEWLESRSQTSRGSTEIQLFFAETALNEGLHGKALEILKEMLSYGREEEPVVKELLSKYQSVPLIRSFYNERFSASLAGAKSSGFEFERYDNSGLAPADDAKPEDKEPGDPDSPPSEEARAGNASRLGVSDLAFGQEADTGRTRACPSPSPDIVSYDFSLSMHAAPDADGAPDAIEERAVPEDPSAFADAAQMADTEDGSDLFEYLNRDFAAKRSAAGKSAKKPVPAALETAAAPSENRLGGPPPDSRVTEPDEPVSLSEESAGFPEDSVRLPEEPISIPDESVGMSEEPVEAPDEPVGLPQDFDSLYQLFLDGKLDRGRNLEMVARAFEGGRLEQMKKLLSFEPATLGEDIARKFQLARYYLAKDQPMPALVALKTVHLNALGKEERKDFLLRIADCYRALHNFEAAHSVYLRIMSEYPGLSDVQLIAQSNYDKYLEAAAGNALALEKTTIL